MFGEATPQRKEDERMQEDPTLTTLKSSNRFGDKAVSEDLSWSHNDITSVGVFSKSDESMTDNRSSAIDNVPPSSSGEQSQTTENQQRCQPLVLNPSSGGVPKSTVNPSSQPTKIRPQQQNNSFIFGENPSCSTVTSTSNNNILTAHPHPVGHGNGQQVITTRQQNPNSKQHVT
ncbi:hypothetical protein ACLOJK_006762 [Asimina triloba]